MYVRTPGAFRQRPRGLRGLRLMRGYRGLAAETCTVTAGGARVCTQDAPAVAYQWKDVCKDPASGPRFKGPTVEWKPPDKDHRRRYAFQYQAGAYDQYSCVPGIADCNSAYNDMLAGPGGEWTPGRLPQEKPACVNQKICVDASGAEVASANCEPVATSTTTAVTPTTTTLLVPGSAGGYVATTDAAVSSAASLWDSIPPWAKWGGGALAAFFAIKALKGR
ncbi:MAG: hypothetical protein ACE14L_04870 [Terriglobales bacterium]